MTTLANNIGILNEFCQKHDDASVLFEELRTDSMLSQFRTKCMFVFGTSLLESVGVGLTKQRAKQDSAARIIETCKNIDPHFFNLPEKPTYGIEKIGDNRDDLEHLIEGVTDTLTIVCKKTEGGHKTLVKYRLQKIETISNFIP
jgi:hypothetical protein